jgi:glucuronosyltransferase
MQWLPQQDLIADNRTKILVGHCGSNGLHEAIYYAVPVLCFPMFAEQQYLCNRAQARGIGKCMDIWNFTVEQFVSGVEEIINNLSYRQAVLKLSSIYRSQPMFGRQKAAYWIEHILKHGSRHLKSPAVTMPLYQMYMLDIVGLFTVLWLGLVCCCVCCCSCSCCCCCQPHARGRPGSSSLALVGQNCERLKQE